jgi:hypothetical protein
MSNADLDKVAGGTDPIGAIGGGLESAGKTIAGWFHL